MHGPGWGGVGVGVDPLSKSERDPKQECFCIVSGSLFEVHLTFLEGMKKGGLESAEFLQEIYIKYIEIPHSLKGVEPGSCSLQMPRF